MTLGSYSLVAECEECKSAEAQRRPIIEGLLEALLKVLSVVLGFLREDMIPALGVSSGSMAGSQQTESEADLSAYVSDEKIFCFYGALSG